MKKEEESHERQGRGKLSARHVDSLEKRNGPYVTQWP